MKFLAKVRFNEPKNEECLLRAFFKEFDPESSIVIKGKEAYLEIVFDEAPEEIIKAISYCEMIEFIYGKSLEDDSQEKSKQAKAETEIPDEPEQAKVEDEIPDEPEQAKVEEDIPDEPEQAKVEEDIPDEPEQVKAEAEIPDEHEQAKAEEDIPDEPEQVKAEEDIPDEPEQVKVEAEIPDEPEQVKVEAEIPDEPEQTKIEDEISELTQIAKKCSSYDEFVKAVCMWLELGKRQKFFENLIKAAIQVEKINWENLKLNFADNGLNYSDSDKIMCSKKITEKFKESQDGMTILRLIKVIVQYQKFDFHEEIVLEKVEGIESSTEKPDSIQFEDNIPNKKVKMQCMPEIPCFEEALGKIDKNQSIEERVKYVLTAMGVEKTSAEEQKQIFKIANGAVKSRIASLDSVFINANIPMQESMYARMIFSKFINDFVRKYAPDKRVKLLDFLKDLQTIVVCKNEINTPKEFKSFTEFNN